MKSPARRALGMLLLSFAGFCLLHEIFYQRIFWLVLGATLTYPGKTKRSLHDGSFKVVPSRFRVVAARLASVSVDRIMRAVARVGRRAA